MAREYFKRLSYVDVEKPNSRTRDDEFVEYLASCLKMIKLLGTMHTWSLELVPRDVDRYQQGSSY